MVDSGQHGDSSSLLVLPGAALLPVPAASSLLSFDEREYDARHFHHATPPPSPGPPSEFVFGRRFPSTGSLGGSSSGRGGGGGAAARGGAPTTLSSSSSSLSVLSLPAARGRQGWVGPDLDAGGGVAGGGGGEASWASAAADGAVDSAADAPAAAGGGPASAPAQNVGDGAEAARGRAPSAANAADSDASARPVPAAAADGAPDEGAPEKQSALLRRGIVWADEVGHPLVEVCGDCCAPRLAPYTRAHPFVFIAPYPPPLSSQVHTSDRLHYSEGNGSPPTCGGCVIC